jgi:hypothetical protein
MFSVRQKMDCVQWLTELKSYSCVRRKFNQVCPNRTAQIYLQIRDALGQEAERERKCLVTTRAATQYAVPWKLWKKTRSISEKSSQFSSSVLDRKYGSHSLALLLSRIDSFRYFLPRVYKRHCSSWNAAKYEPFAWENCQNFRVRCQWNACQYVSRNWISSWRWSCH